ncbi:hypothetical protein [Heyndrickxia acidicola]|uniref:Uncharacterized protein n=1 Tax=Heyndrickxia acidicola TaxID=209389 RepID=A0ABU6MLA0_9BACI|nr:hypothetical protein [Heyndrickxia acidicola]MED1205456.1 hypothetical protein [Heyndrickxia acidicola]
MYRNELAALINKEVGNDKKKIALQKSITLLEKELKGIHIKFDRIFDLLEDGVYSREEYIERKEKLKNKQKDIESELLILRKQFKNQDSIADKDKVKILDLVLNNFNKIVEEQDINKLFKSIISHVELSRVSNEDEGQNFL